MPNIEKQKRIFLILSFISGIIELGTIFLGINLQYSVIEIIGLALAYQIGNLVPNPISLGYRCIIILSTIVGILLVAFYYRKTYMFLFCAIALLGMIIQMGRCYSKSKVSTTKKRLFRIGGFFISPIFNQYVLFVLAGITLIITLMNRVENKSFEFRVPKIRLISVIMIIHQIHYFIYSYFMILILNSIIKDSFQFYISFIFVLGWCTYISVPHLIRSKNYQLNFIMGHIFLTIILLCIFLLYPSKLLIIPWILTGFGGGTVYCIEKINGETKKVEKEDITFAENIGHIIGTTLGMVLFAVSSSIVMPIIGSCVAATSAMLLMVLHLFKNQEIPSRENEYDRVG